MIRPFLPHRILICVMLLLPGAIFSQHQELKVLGHNVIFGGLTSGVGAVINRKSNCNWRKTFVRSFWQGSIGGLLNYSAKKTIYLIDKNNSLAYAFPARMLSSAGNSIIQNAAFNEPFLQNWHFDYGFLRVDFSTRSERKFRARILPTSIITSVMALPKGKLDLNSTLLIGVMTFRSRGLIQTMNGQHDGVNYGRAFIYLDDTLKYHIMSHEIIHEYQYREFLVFNSYLEKPVSKLKTTGLKKMLSKYVYPDLPYFGLFYMLETVEPDPRFFRNYYEFEAERFATNKHVPVN